VTGRRLALLFALLAVVNALAPPTPLAVAHAVVADLPQGSLGSWAGTAEQTSPTQSSVYEMRIELTGSKQYAPISTVAYTTSNWTCGGSLVLWLVLDENSIAAGKHITTGNNVCPNGGFVQLISIGDGTLSYEWRMPGILDVTMVTLAPAATFVLGTDPDEV
jgi:hypothetical protein